jgi:MinD superfamily P-loop ATPase
MVATSLALSILGTESVQLLDCDVEEPNASLFLNSALFLVEAVCIPIPVVAHDRCNRCGTCAAVCAFNAIAVFESRVLVFPELCHGCGACSLLCPQKAILEGSKEIGLVESSRTTGGIELIQGKLNIGAAKPSPVIRSVKAKAKNRGVVIIDGPPGTSCSMVESVKGSHFCVLVTEPTPFGLSDLTQAVETIKRLDIPCGIVLNRAGSGNDGVESFCRQEKLPILMSIPLETEIARAYSKGLTLVESQPRWKGDFLDLYGRVKELASEGTCSLKW